MGKIGSGIRNKHSGSATLGFENDHFDESGFSEVRRILIRMSNSTFIIRPPRSIVIVKVWDMSPEL
jgi:hypothetical protein